jgi:hypothetical protein
VAQPAVDTSTPTLRVRTYDPFVVRGLHFRPLERVKLTLDGTWTRRARADGFGRFLAAFRGVAVDVCDGFVVKALGSAGSRASMRTPARECPSRSPG